MRSWPGSRSSGSNGITSRPANRCRTALSKASTAVCATSVSTSTCSPISTRLVRSSRNGGSTTTPTDRTRASTGSRQPSLQPAPTRAKPRTESPYKRGQIGEQVRARANNYFTAPSADRDTETDHARVAAVFRSIENALDGAKAEQAGLKSRIDDVLARAAVTSGNGSDEYLTRDPEDNHYQRLLNTEFANGQLR